MKSQVRIKPYYGLQIISAIYKALSIIAVIVTIVIIVNNSYNFAIEGNFPPFPYFHLATWIVRDAIIGLVVALTLFVMAQLIDVQITMAKQMRQLVDLVENQSQNGQMEEVVELLKKQSADVQEVKSGYQMLRRRAAQARQQRQPE